MHCLPGMGLGMQHCVTRIRSSGGGRRGFSLAELLVVIGILSLLMALIVSPIQLARRQAMAARCGAQQKDIGIALMNAKSDYGHYPVWDDNGSPTRYTWVDVLVELGLLGNPDVAYCPEDPQPSTLNAARARHYQVLYPNSSDYGIDYSYGIGVPLSAGGQYWRPGVNPEGDGRPRRFVEHDKFPANRVMVGDANWSCIYNLSNTWSFDWSYPSVFDNMVAYRHSNDTANFLFQDGHVERVRYALADETVLSPIDTQQVFVWHPGESLNVGPEDAYRGNYYPDEPPVDPTSVTGSAIPLELVPSYYTEHHLWSQVYHK